MTTPCSAYVELHSDDLVDTVTAFVEAPALDPGIRLRESPPSVS